MNNWASLEINFWMFQFIQAVCIYYDLMSQRTKEEYSAVLRHLNTICAFEELEVIMADFEKPMRDGAAEEFENVLIAGCNVHHDRISYTNDNFLRIKYLWLSLNWKNNLQAMYRHLKPLQQHFDEKDEVAEWAKKIMVLAFFPAERIPNLFEKITKDMPEEVSVVLERFVKYYKRQWLGIVKPQGFSVFGLENRTKNCAEVHNAELLRLLGTRSVACEFLCK